MVGDRRPYPTVAGETVEPDEYDLLARIMSMGTAHHAYAVTGSMYTAAVAMLPGTVPSEYLETDATGTVRIDHPKGTMRVDVELDGPEVVSTSVDRTARPILDGWLYGPGPIPEEWSSSDGGSPSTADSA